VRGHQRPIFLVLTSRRTDALRGFLLAQPQQTNSADSSSRKRHGNSAAHAQCLKPALFRLRQTNKRSWAFLDPPARAARPGEAPQRGSDSGASRLACGRVTQEFQRAARKIGDRSKSADARAARLRWHLPMRCQKFGIGPLA
jgi:hypothetical protein